MNPTLNKYCACKPRPFELTFQIKPALFRQSKVNPILANAPKS
jgi:hypothetical protein